MSLGDTFDELIERLRGYGPYGISVALGCIGLGMFKLGGDGRLTCHSHAMGRCGDLRALSTDIRAMAFFPLASMVRLAHVVHKPRQYPAKRAYGSSSVSQ